MLKTVHLPPGHHTVLRMIAAKQAKNIQEVLTELVDAAAKEHGLEEVITNDANVTITVDDNIDGDCADGSDSPSAGSPCK